MGRFHEVQRLLRPQFILPILLTGALLFFAFSISRVGQVARYIENISLANAGIVFGLACAYLALKFLQLRALLAGLDIHPTTRQLILAFMIGEMTVPLPSGVYAQNYVLRHMRAAGFARSSAATTAVLILEGTVVYLTLLAVGVPGWTWLRPTILGSIAVICALALVVLKGLQPVWRSLDLRFRHNLFSRGLIDLLHGMRSLLAWRVLAPALAVSVTYLYALVLAFFVIGRGIGIRLRYEEALSIYFFSLGVTLALGGLLSQLGVIEVAGLGASEAWKLTATQGLGMMIAFRIVWTGTIWFVGAVTMGILRSEFRAPGDGEVSPR